MMSRFVVQRVISSSSHPHGEHVSPLLELFCPAPCFCLTEIQDLQSNANFLKIPGDMEVNAEKPPSNFSATKPKVQRDRSLPSSRPFNIAAFFSALYFLALIATFTAMVLFFKEPNPLSLKFMLGGLGMSIVSWTVAFFRRRAALCPLCKGTPLINSGALPHSKAVRVFPLNHGMTATLSIMTSQRFCCMYCGSSFDLLKPSAHLRGTKRTDSAE
jgi:hypothetical protein